MSFLKGTKIRVLTLVFFLHAALLYSLSHGEVPPSHPPLSSFPQTIGSWNMVSEGVVEEQVQAVLKADDLLTRTYSEGSNPAPVNLFVAYFTSQRTGKAPHSPKNCLPGSGWAPAGSAIIEVPIPGRADPISVNRYIVAKGDQRSVVLYWYQTSRRAIASEYMAKVYLVTDAIRYNRTDTSLVRIVVPVPGEDVARAETMAIEFAKLVYPEFSKFMPV